MDKFLELLRQSVIIQGLSTVIWFVVTGTLLIMKTPVDQQWYLFGIAIMAFWFGGKAVMMTQSTLQKVKETQDNAKPE